MFVKIILATEKMKDPKSPSSLLCVINLVVFKPAGNVTIMLVALNMLWMWRKDAAISFVFMSESH